MKRLFKIGMISTIGFAVIQTAAADNCITQGDFLNQTHSLHSTSLDPYAHLLPRLDAGNDIAAGYNLQLKPLVVNDLSRLQFETRDSSSPAAGYTSPYLWEVGQGPGYKSRYGNWRGSSFGPSSPFPIPTRR